MYLVGYISDPLELLIEIILQFGPKLGQDLIFSFLEAVEKLYTIIHNLIRKEEENKVVFLVTLTILVMG